MLQKGAVGRVLGLQNILIMTSGFYSKAEV